MTEKNLVEELQEEAEDYFGTDKSLTLKDNLDQIVSSTVESVCRKLNKKINEDAQENECASDSFLVDTRDVDGKCEYLIAQARKEIE